MYSLDDLNVSKSCETAFEFEVINSQTGKGVGVFISVLGAHCERLAALVKSTMNERRTADAMAAKRDPRNMQVHVQPVETDLSDFIEQVAIRVVGWRGISEPYSPEAAIKLCTINPTIKDQILAKSEDLANFPLAVPQP
jgi:hypothetical protein